ncbi:MAG TPA: RNB domain-containing ribonuclease [Thermoanaerobaculia bacterium]|jgi:exoribonuclease-2|nr:RNB domain-containing ribonuclease [Thermoanaerobaculia bacterium]
MNRKHEQLLVEIAHDAMVDKGLKPDFDRAVLNQVDEIHAPARDEDARDLRDLPWCSIDNDDSRDLDQLTWAEDRGDGDTRILIAVADVDALVRKDTPVDRHARHNTTSVYTAAKVFSMLPEKLSTDLTSLNEGEDRVAVVIEMLVREDGTSTDGDVYRARVHNHAKLAYDRVAAWLDGEDDEPENMRGVKGLADTLRLQDRIADKMRDLRHQNGALDLETIEARPVIRDGKVVDLRQAKRNNARLLIEDFMIAANGTTARFLAGHKLPSIRRVVRSPERWDRIERIAEDLGERLPPEPDPIALEQFLKRRRKADPMRFPDLSLSIVKAMGAGEYVVEEPGDKSTGHFGLAVKDYTHSTAPNRRYPDLITHRLVKCALDGRKPPYSVDELAELAEHCTAQEDAANKVERTVRKAAAACMLSGREGEHFDGVVTGASQKGTWVRIFRPPIEGKLVRGWDGLDIGDRVRVKLLEVDIERGFIDFGRAG